MAVRTVADGVAHDPRAMTMHRPERDDLSDSNQRRLMPSRLRLSVYVVFGGVWMTGCAWWVLHRYFASPGPFGVARHPWESTAALLHGVLAIATAFLFGWVMARHGSEGWQQRKRRVSGGALAAVVAVLSISGFALFFLIDADWRNDTAIVHDTLGLLVTAFAAEHWRTSKARGEG